MNANQPQESPKKPPITSAASPPVEAAALARPPEVQAEGAPRKRRGFAVMDPAKVREIARRGAAAARANGTAHRFTSEEAREAGRKGGRAPHRVRGQSRRSEVERDG